MGFLSCLVSLLFANAANVRNILGVEGGLCASEIVIAFVEAQMLRRDLGWLGTLHNNGIQSASKQTYIRDIGSGNADSKRSAAAFDKQAFLDPCLGAISGVLADALLLRPFLGMPRALPKQPSAACQCQSTPTNKVVTGVEQDSPEFVEDAFLLPTAEGAVDADVITELRRQGIPLAAASQSIKDAVTRFALVNARASHP